MKNLPTDLDILNEIYNRYYNDFAKYDHDESIRRNKLHVPIDIAVIAKYLGVDEDIIFLVASTTISTRSMDTKRVRTLESTCSICKSPAKDIVSILFWLHRSWQACGTRIGNIESPRRWRAFP
jgi:hypothetical protein